MKGENLLLVAAIGVIVGATIWWNNDDSAVDAHERLDAVHDRVVELEKERKEHFEELRQAAWEARNPCPRVSGFILFQQGYPVKYPTQEWCKKAEAQHEKEKADGATAVKRDSQIEEYIGDMYDCVYKYDSAGLQSIDSIKDPKIHNSWVLGGGCERIAHTLQARQTDAMCLDYVDDSPVLARNCQREMQRFLEIWCLEEERDDGSLRGCLSHHMITKLDPEAKELLKELKCDDPVGCP